MASELDKLTRYADQQEKKASQLQVALESRVVIEQAVGMLAERFDLSVAEGFDLLRRAAHTSRREIRALAAELTQSRSTLPRSRPSVDEVGVRTSPAGRWGQTSSSVAVTSFSARP